MFTELRALRLKKYRQAAGVFLVEGARLTLEAARSQQPMDALLATGAFRESERWAGLKEAADKRGLPVEQITATQAKQLSETRNPQGVFGVCRLPGQTALADGAPKSPILILDRISDPGNLGTLLRTADWFGIPTVWISADSADIYSPKVVRGGMGAHFHIAYMRQGDLTEAGDRLARADITVWGASVNGTPLDQMGPLPERWALALGSEARGLSRAWKQRADVLVSVSGHGPAESLNVAVAGGVILHQLSTGSS